MAWPANTTSHLTETALTLFSAKTAATTAPVDTKWPPYVWASVGDGTTDHNSDGQAPAVGSIRCDGFRQLSLSVEVFTSSGAGTAVFRPYFWDGARWVKCGDAITLTVTVASSTPAARERHDIIVEHDYGFCLVLESITGTAATAAAYATRKDPILGRR